jgi:putative oxidoreductase
VLLLVIRPYWGWSFFLTGKGKLLNLEKTTAFFTELNLPLPKMNALMAGSAECVSELLLMPGLGSRRVSVPLMATMGVANNGAPRRSGKNGFRPGPVYRGGRVSVSAGEGDRVRVWAGAAVGRRDGGKKNGGVSV